MTRFPALAAIRIGCVQYLNSRPLIHDYPGPVRFDHPSGLARDLASGALDAALVPIFEALRDPQYVIADDVAIASRGAVFSVFLAHRVPLALVRQIALDPASLTSAHLLQVLLREYHGLTPTVIDARETGPGDPEAMLLIGNQAIDFRLADAGRYELLDLGEEWMRCTGLSFVFAAWAIRRGLDGKEIAAEFRSLKRAGLAGIETIVAAEHHYAPELSRRYLTESIHYDLREPEKAGIARYAELLAKHGFIPAAPELEFV